MNRATPGCAPLERLLAGTLHYGTWLASAAIGLGLMLALIDSRFSGAKLTILRDMRIATVGIVLLILLPVVRVIVMLIVFLRQRDYHLSAIALLVLTIILLGFAAGLAGSKHRDTPSISDSGVISHMPFLASDRQITECVSEFGHWLPKTSIFYNAAHRK
jgi:hypothetical protein